MKEVIAIYDDSIWVLKEESEGFIFGNKEQPKYGANGHNSTEEEAIEFIGMVGAKIYREI